MAMAMAMLPSGGVQYISRTAVVCTRRCLHRFRDDLREQTEVLCGVVLSTARKVEEITGSESTSPGRDMLLS